MDTVVGGESACAGPEEKNPRLSSSTTDCCAPQKLPTDLFSSASPLQVLGATGTGPISQEVTQTTGQECWCRHPHGVPTDGGGTGFPCHWPPSTFPWPGSDVQRSSKAPKGCTPGYGGLRLHADLGLPNSGLTLGVVGERVGLDPVCAAIVPVEIRYKGKKHGVKPAVSSCLNLGRWGL